MNLKTKKIQYYILFAIVITLSLLTIAYAALATSLTITGNADVIASNWNIHLENPMVKNGSVTTTKPSLDSSTTMSFNVTLTKPGDFYEFTVDVVNNGTIDAMIDSVVKEPELTTTQAKYIKYEVSYENGESISNKQTIKSGTTTPIKVRIEYRNDLIASDLPTTNTTLSLKLTLVYVQSDNTGTTIVNNGAETTLIDTDFSDAAFDQDMTVEILEGNGYYEIENGQLQLETSTSFGCYVKMGITFTPKYASNLSFDYGKYHYYGDNDALTITLTGSDGSSIEIINNYDRASYNGTLTNQMLTAGVTYTISVTHSLYAHADNYAYIDNLKVIAS